MNDSILTEAQRLTTSDRHDAYGHPSENFGRAGAIITACLSAKLRPGATITATDVGLIMLAIKLARECHQHKRDNLVDLAGYANTIDMIHQKEGT